MKNGWINLYSGYVKIRITGKGLERLLNQFMRGYITIWDVKRHGDEAVTLCLSVKDISALRRIIRGTGCKVTFLGRHGGPFFLKKVVRNGGFTFGLLLFFFVILILSNMIWNIEIKGASPETEHKVGLAIHDIGIEKGKFHFFLPPPEVIQQEIQERIDSAVWIGVTLKGTTYEFDVVEKKDVDEKEMLSPRHLVAKKEGVIVDMFVEQGQPAVAINDFVKKGDLLVSGIIGKEGNTQIVPSIGKIFAEIWYKSEVIIPYKTTFNVFTGNVDIKHFVKIGHINIPIWGFGKVEYKKFVIEDEESKVHFLKWTLPVSYSKKMIREMEKVTRTYTKEEALITAEKSARKKLIQRLDEDAKIKGEKVLHQTEENGKVKLTIHYKVIEEISSAQPIIQGD